MGNEDPITTGEEEAEGTIRPAFSTPTVSEKGLKPLDVETAGSPVLWRPALRAKLKKRVELRVYV